VECCTTATTSSHRHTVCSRPTKLLGQQRANKPLVHDGGRVGAPSRPGAPLTEPDLWATHPALRDAGVEVSLWTGVSVSTRSYPSGSVSCSGTRTARA
jgi:hypothetical protein